MSTFELIRLILGCVFLFIGVFVFVTEVIGIFRMRYVLNRMHAAGMGDTLGLFSSMVGCMILSGFNMNTLKMLFVIVFLWFTSPVATHLLAKMETQTNDDIDKYLEDDTL